MDQPRIHHIAIHVQDAKKEAAHDEEVFKLEKKERGSSGTIYLSDGFIGKQEFKKQIDDWMQVFRNTKPAPGTNGPLIPGDREREAEAVRSKEGIALLKPVMDDLLDIAKKTGARFEAEP